MKNLFKVLGIIAFSVIIAFIMATCDDGGTPDPCASGHTPGAAATCETAQTCTVCSQVIKAAIGHNWNEWEVDTISETCVDGSKDTTYCLNNNCTKTDERTGSKPALGHNLPGAYAATCMAVGSTGTGHCNRCNEDFTGDVIPINSNNHDFGEWALKTAATCVAPERQIRVCSYNETHAEEQDGEINTTAHDWDWTLNAIAATCVSVSKDTATCKNEPCTETNERDGSNVIAPTFHNWTQSRQSSVRTGVNAKICNNGCDKLDDIELTLEIGVTGPAGGIIFYTNAEGFTVEGYTGAIGAFETYTAYYLEAAPKDEGKSAWGAYDILIAYVTTFTSPNDSKALLIGNGRKDTQIIVNHLTTTSETGRAAQLCASKTITVGITVFNDWFLPSLGELNEMYKAAKGQSGIPTSGYFWSSSQQNGSYAWGQLFDYGSQGLGDKSISNYACAIRAF